MAKRSKQSSGVFCLVSAKNTADIAAVVKRIEVGFAADTAVGIADIAVAADIAFVEVVAASCFLET